MIAKPSIAFNDFAGTAKEVTARNVNGRNVLSVRAKQSKVVTPSQALSRNQLSKVSRAYKQLSDSQMAAWAALAEHLKGISTFGLAAEMTAHNAFVRINENRSMVGMSLLSDAPEYRANIPSVICSNVWVTQTKIILTGIQHQPENYRLVIKMSKGVSAGITNGWSKMVIVAPGKEEDWGDANVTSSYADVIGFAPALGDKLFIELWWLDVATGFTGEAFRTNKVCITDQEAQQQGFRARKLFTMDNVVVAESSVDELNLEFTTGSFAFAIDAIGHGSKSTSSYKIVLSTNLGYDYRDHFWMMGRGADGTNMVAQAYQGWFGSDDEKTYMHVNRRCGKAQTRFEIFGPGLFYR